MIQVTIGTNTDRSQVVIDPATTLRTVLEDNEVNYAVTTIHLDGVSLKPGDIDKTFNDFGVKDKCYLIAVAKVDNA